MEKRKIDKEKFHILKHLIGRLEQMSLEKNEPVIARFAFEVFFHLLVERFGFQLQWVPCLLF